MTLRCWRRARRVLGAPARTHAGHEQQPMHHGCHQETKTGRLAGHESFFFGVLDAGLRLIVGVVIALMGFVLATIASRGSHQTQKKRPGCNLPADVWFGFGLHGLPWPSWPSRWTGLPQNCGANY